MADRLLIKPQGNPVGYDKDLVDQINNCLRARDRVLDQLLAEPVCFAFGIGTTTGTGNVTPLKEFGGKLEIQSNNVAIRFTTRRADALYVFGAMILDTNERFPLGPGLAAKGADTCVVRFINRTGGTVNASITVFSFMIWAIGGRL